MRSILFGVLIGLGATAATAGTVQGRVDITIGGDPVGCNAAKLVPRTPETEQAILAQFGSLESSALKVPAEVVTARMAEGPEPGSRETRCYDWRGYGNLVGFRFGNVAPGDYFVTLLSRAGREAYSDDLVRGARKEAIYLMQPVRVTKKGASVRFAYVHK